VICSTPGCGATAIAKGRCNRCYNAKIRGYRPAAPREDRGPVKFIGSTVPVTVAKRLYREARAAKMSVAKAIEHAVQSWVNDQEWRRK
jgi:hypothetical protein